MGYTIDKKIYLINIFLLGFVLLCIFYLLYINVAQQKNSALVEAQNKTESLARFITTDIDRIIYGVEEIIEGIYNSDMHISNHAEHEHELDRLLKKTLRPYMSDILVVDNKAQIVHWTQEAPKPNIKDREYITFHLTNPNSMKTFIGKPQTSKLDPKKQFFAVSKAFYMQEKLDRIIVITLNLDFFYKRYMGSMFNKNSSILMASSSGILYTRYPVVSEYVGQEVNEIMKFGKMGIKRKHFDIMSPLDQKSRIATLVHSDNYPIVGGVSMLKADVLKSWKKYKNNTIFITLLLALGFILTLIYYSRLQKKLITLSQIDGLTQLFNRGHFTKEAQKEFTRARRFNEEISIIMLDIDNFKHINDTYGHHTGDKVIKKISKNIFDNTRDIDLCARYGGEEFIILLVETSAEGAVQVAKRIKDSFEKRKKKLNFPTTASFGVASLKSTDKKMENIVQRADKALYISKNSGKNCIHSI